MLPTRLRRTRENSLKSATVLRQPSEWVNTETCSGNPLIIYRTSLLRKASTTGKSSIAVRCPALLLNLQTSSIRIHNIFDAKRLSLDAIVSPGSHIPLRAMHHVDLPIRHL